MICIMVSLRDHTIVRKENFGIMECPTVEFAIKISMRDPCMKERHL
jgi:hypothetical protein